MLIKKIIAVITAVSSLLLLQCTVFSEGEFHLSSAYVTENFIDIFGNFDTETVEISLSGQAASIVTSGLIGETGVLVRTTVLLDISTSMPSTVRDEVLTFINMMIEDLPENEQIKLIAFAEELTVLQDFTSDRESLKAAAGEIKFTGQESKIYDALYNTIPAIAPIDGIPCFYRTILITDGIDDTKSGVTKEELYVKLSDEIYPIDTVAVSRTKQSEPDKELSALMRLSGGTYSNIYPDLDPAAVNLSVNSLTFIRAALPEALLDGSIRPVKISDGESEITFEATVPIYKAPLTPSTVITATAETTTAAASTAAASTAAASTAAASTAAITEIEAAAAAESAQTTPVTEPGKLITTLFGINIIYIIGGGVAIALIIVIIIILVSRKNKNSEDSDSDYIAAADADEDIGKTVFAYSEPKTGVTIKLTNTQNPEKTFTLTVLDQIIIGRAEHCDIRLEDSSVSREQCKIVLAEKELIISEMSGSNKTLLNGAEIGGGKPLSAGDVIAFGRVSLTVEYIKSSN